MKNKPLRPTPLVEPTTTETALAFVRGLQKFRKKGGAPADEALVKEYVNQFPLGRLQSIARRIIMDIMTAPLGRGPAHGDDKAPPRRIGAPKKRTSSTAKKAKHATKELARAAPRRGREMPNRTGRRGPDDEP